MKKRILTLAALGLFVMTMLGGCHSCASKGGNGEKGGNATSAVTTLPPRVVPDTPAGITQDVYTQYRRMAYLLGSPIEQVAMDKKKTLRGYPDYWLVTDTEYMKWSGIQQTLRIAVTEHFIEAANLFTDDYGAFRDAAERPLYCEYDYSLYAYSGAERHPDYRQYDFSTARQVSRDEDTLVTEVDWTQTLGETGQGKAVFKMKLDNGVWKLDVPIEYK